MAGESSFLVEDFIDAITSQLDRVQDALRIKAVNRPLTYALKDLSLELKVFVELDPQGRVRFRTSAANETGASSVHLAFTTITKPMIEENTISLATSRSPSLAEAGMDEHEARRLERLGIRNVAELQNLGRSAGVSAVSRLAAVSTDRLKLALGAGKPRIDVVKPVVPSPPKPKPGVKPTPPQVQIKGKNLLGGSVKLGNRTLAIAEADDDELIVDLPHDATSGALEVTLPDGEVMEWSLTDEWMS